MLNVTCVTKPHRFSPHEHITEIGNQADGWRYDTQTAVRLIEAGVARFVVADSRIGKVSEVGVVRRPGHLPYLRTHADGYYNDNLLALNNCPL